MTLTEREAADLVEPIEAEFAVAMIEVGPPALAAQLRTGYRRHAAAVATWAAALDILSFNRVLGVGLHDPVTPRLLDGLLADYVAAGARRFFVQPSPVAQPPELERWLESRAFTLHNRWAKLYRRVEPLPPASVDLHIEEIGAHQAEDFSRTVASAFGFPPLVERLCAATVGARGWRHYVGYEGGRPVGSAASFVRGDVVWLGMAGTSAGQRGRGVQSALIRRRLRDAAAMGCEWAVAETAEDIPEKPAPSFRNMRRLGFELAYHRPNWMKVLAPRPG